VSAALDTRPEENRMVETDDALVENLLRIADGSPDDTAERLRTLDPDRVATAVLQEVVARAALFPGPATPLTVQFDLGIGERRLGHVVTLTPDGGGTARRGWVDDPWLTVRQDLAELLRAVHGPPGTHDATREVVVKDPPSNIGADSEAPWIADLQAATLGSYQVVKACSPHHADLALLAVRFGSDKWGSHWYTPHYERHFAPFRQQRVKVLELGVGGYSSPEWGGGSLRMWRHYFPRGLVYGLDVFDKSALDRPRMKTVLGDQSDPVFLAELAGRIGPFDIVVDDGSHLSSDVITSFTALFPHVRPGGLYVIEDLQTSYWPGWNGGSTDPHDPATSTGMLKALVDGLHHQDAVHDRPHEPSHTDRTVTGIHLYHNIAFIEKAVNSDQPAMSWLRKDVHPYASSGDSGAE
jgi:demethylmacrocin O-methyltransferase